MQTETRPKTGMTLHGRIRRKRPTLAGLDDEASLDLNLRDRLNEPTPLSSIAVACRCGCQVGFDRYVREHCRGHEEREQRHEKMCELLHDPEIGAGGAVGKPDRLDSLIREMRRPQSLFFRGG